MSRKRVASLVLVLVGCSAGLAFNAFVALQNTEYWHIDFNQFYSAGELAGTGRLYDWNALWDVEKQHGKYPSPLHRIPIFAAGFKPLSSLLPYPAAVRVWFGISLAALAFFVMRCPFGKASTAAVIVCWSHPLALTLAYGQDDALLLLYCAAAVLLLRSGKEGKAGLIMALCISKPNIGIGMPVFLGAQRRWRAFAAAAMTVAVAVLASFLLEGIAWPVRLAAMLRLPFSDQAPGRMPNVRGMVSWLPATTAIELVLTAVLLFLLWRVCTAQKDPGIAGAVTLASGLVLGHHGYLQDAALLIPLLIAVLDRPVPYWMKISAVVLASPVPYFMLLSQWPFAGQGVIVGIAIALISSFAVRDCSRIPLSRNRRIPAFSSPNAHADAVSADPRPR